MSNFIKFKELVKAQIALMSKGTLLQSAASRDDMWDTYLTSFKTEHNKIYRERSEHDCQCCRQFIRQVGGMLSILDGKLVSVWDVDAPEEYINSTKALSKLVLQAGADTVYLHYADTVGIDHNFEDTANGAKKWEHFHTDLPAKVVADDSLIATIQGKAKTNKQVLERSMGIADFAIETVLDLINTGSIYKGDEYLNRVEQLQKVKAAFVEAGSDSEIFFWEISAKLGPASNFRSGPIGELLVNLSDGDELEAAVGKYEAMVAPSNYKRSTAVVTAAMVDRAYAAVESLGIEAALERRCAVIDDVSINDVLFADNSVKKRMGGFEGLVTPVAVKAPKDSAVTEISSTDFLELIKTGGISTIDMLVENKHKSNFVGLIAPVNAKATSILKWNNNFSWNYKGEVTDSIKERVKSVGACVDGALRCSLQWNESGQDNIDLDLHCQYGTDHMYFGSKVHRTGSLDYDIRSPGNEIAVENIIFSKIESNQYTFFVNNFSSRACTGGFRAEIEFDGCIHSFNYPKSVRGNANVPVASVVYNNGKVTLVHADGIEYGETPTVEWGITTHNYHRVTTIMNSPNHWGDQTLGNKHLFFMLEGCVNPEPARGFYNEFLMDSLNEHRKVFEVLASKTKAPSDVNQLSGLGFSSTIRNSIVCRVRGTKINRDFEIQF